MSSWWNDVRLYIHIYICIYTYIYRDGVVASTIHHNLHLWESGRFGLVAWKALGMGEVQPPDDA